jgi:uncharacterized protein
MAPNASRPIPQPNSYVYTEPFWAAARERKLFLQFCTDTNRFQHYPRPVSIYSGGRNLEWREVSGKGRIYACTVLRVGRPEVAARLPLQIATIELDEGVRIIGNIIDSRVEDIKIDAPVIVAWDMLDGGAPYPAFQVATGR